MMTDPKKKTLILVGAIAVIVLAGFAVFRTASAPTETITDFKDVPPKGAGKWGE